MTLRHFQIFRAVCENESITLAAEKLNMTQPAVSIAIKELESFYNTKLFERMNRRIYLTQYGRTLLQYCETVLNQFDESVDVLRYSGQVGRCSFGVNVTIGETKLAELTAEILKSIPSVELKIVVDNTHIIEKKLSENEIDFAIVDNLSLSNNWKQTLLFSEEMSLVCAPKYFGKTEISTNELSREKLLLRESGSGSRESVDSVFQRHGCKASPFVESSSSDSLIQMAENGFGFTVMPTELIKNQLKSGSLISLNISDDKFTRYHYLIFHEKKYLTSAMDEVIKIITDNCHKAKQMV